MRVEGVSVVRVEGVSVVRVEGVSVVRVEGVSVVRVEGVSVVRVEGVLIRANGIVGAAIECFQTDRRTDDSNEDLTGRRHGGCGLNWLYGAYVRKTKLSLSLLRSSSPRRPIPMFRCGGWRGCAR